MGAPRILYLIDSLGPGGAQRQLVTLVRALGRDDVEPAVAIYHPLYHFRPDLEAVGVPIVEVGPGRARDPRVLLELRRLFDRGGYELVHSWLRIPGVLARVAASLAGGPPVIVSERSVDLGRSVGSVLLERALARRATRMIVNAHAIEDHIEGLVPAWKGRIRVVPNGLEWTAPTDDDLEGAEAFRREHAQGADVLLGAVGRIEHQKAPDLLLDALALLPREVFERLRVVWVGPVVDRALAARITGRASEPPLAGRFTLVAATRSIRPVYLAIDGLILASRWEGLPNAVLEALGHGVPVVATDVGDTARLVEPSVSGWLVRPSDPGGLAGAIAAMVRTAPDRRAAMGRAGGERVRDEYSAAKLAERTVAVYREVLGSGGGDGGHG